MARSRATAPRLPKRTQIDPPEARIRRVELIKRITFQGPEDWVFKCLLNQLTGCTEMGPGKYVISEIVRQREGLIDMVTPDNPPRKFTMFGGEKPE